MASRDWVFEVCARFMEESRIRETAVLFLTWHLVSTWSSQSTFPTVDLREEHQSRFFGLFLFWGPSLVVLGEPLGAWDQSWVSCMQSMYSDPLSHLPVPFGRTTAAQLLDD